jgi:hypothetical protein
MNAADRRTLLEILDEVLAQKERKVSSGSVRNQMRRIKTTEQCRVLARAVSHLKACDEDQRQATLQAIETAICAAELNSPNGVQVQPSAGWPGVGDNIDMNYICTKGRLAFDRVAKFWF